ncbi:right-handed parallel beta-helix repeat-containing protein [Pontiellaceae bacterium B1224]|nr:right-handed parallel beta-helix repeat-containing protein [Pontiellaceae bacterium B1224]
MKDPFRMYSRTLTVLLSMVCLQGLAADCYVSPEGSDTNKGSIDEPFQTLERARQVVRKVLPRAREDINVWIRGGTYYLTDSLEFGPADSGSSKVQITYSAYPDETVIISGAVLLSPDWSTYEGDILVADVGRGLKFDVLFANGDQQIMARYPNFDPNVNILSGYAPDAASKERAARWSNPSTGFVRALHGAEWGGNSYRIKGIRSNGDPDLDWAGDNNRGKGMHKKYRMVENLFEELDAPGEWFYDEAAGKLYFFPPAGMDASSATFEGATLEELIRIVGTAKEKVKDLTFKNLTFTGTHRTLFTREYEGLQRSDWRVARTGAIFIQDAENITISDSNFDHVGGNAIFLSAYNRNHLITNNEFISNGATCVNVVGSTKALRHINSMDDYITEDEDIDGKEGPLTEDYPKDITISYNHMQDNGRFEKQSAGVNISMAESITVSHNTIHGAPRAGLNVCDGTWGGHIFEFNDLFDCVNETHDHGPFNSWGRDRFYGLGGYKHSGEYGKRKRPFALLEAYKTTIIRNNRVHYDKPTSFGIDLDDGSSNYEIYNNLLLNTEIKLREGFDRKVYNNIQINKQNEFHVWYDQSRDIYINNIVVNKTAYNSKYMHSRKARSAEATIDENLFYNGGDEVKLSDDNWESSGYDANSVIADPMFVNPAEMDYRVKPGSPALKLGFKNFPMDQFGKPGAPQPSPITIGSGGSADTAAEPLMGGMIAIITDMATQSVLGAPDLNGVFFESLPADSYAAKQGFRKQDLIRTMNGTDVTTKESFWALYKSIKPGSTVVCTIVRNQHEESFSFVKPAH